MSTERQEEEGEGEGEWKNDAVAQISTTEKSRARARSPSRSATTRESAFFLRRSFLLGELPLPGPSLTLSENTRQCRRSLATGISVRHEYDSKQYPLELKLRMPS